MTAPALLPCGNLCLDSPVISDLTQNILTQSTIIPVNPLQTYPKLLTLNDFFFSGPSPAGEVRERDEAQANCEGIK